MVAIAFRFPAGRYHATPWGRHVNEAAVAWPPEPWRIVRGFIATWHRKVDHATYSEEALTSLLGALAGEPPVYQLPEAIHAHTRHYMPVRSGRQDKKTLIFDAFVRLAPEAELVVAWPSVDLDPNQTALLDDLLTPLGYLGRAESWVEARRLAVWEGEPNCVPGEEAVDPDTGEVLGEVVPLYLPQPPGEYGQLRERMLSGLTARGLKPRERKRVEATLPEAWLAALSLDTSDLQAAGWSAPPAARLIHYLRPEAALQPMAPPRPKPSRPSASPTTARFALYGRPLPRVEDAVKVGEWLRSGLMGQAKRILGEDRIPPELAGHHGSQRAEGHDHAFFLPEDADGDGRIDHVVLHIPAGLSADGCQVVAALRRLWTREGYDWQVILEGLGGGPALAAATPLFGESRTWLSVTPYLHPWHVKKRFTVADQLRRECRERGLPELSAVEAIPTVQVASRPRHAVHFYRFRSKRGLTQPDTHGSFWRLTFAEPVAGPLALGFACHFGLGLFRRE